VRTACARTHTCTDAPRRIGDAPYLDAFAETIDERWNVGHCDDSLLIVICTECERVSHRAHTTTSRVAQVLLHHGDWTKTRKIPDRVGRTMQSQANQLLAFTNYSVVIDYLLVNYRRVLSNANQVSSWI
jgi:hypothetical protein